LEEAAAVVVLGLLPERTEATLLLVQLLLLAVVAVVLGAMWPLPVEAVVAQEKMGKALVPALELQDRVMQVAMTVDTTVELHLLEVEVVALVASAKAQQTHQLVVMVELG
jgi:hypothetical protein